MFNTQEWAVFDIESYKLKEMYAFQFPKDPKDHSDVMVTSYDHDEFYDFDIVMTNHNQIYLISKTERENFIYFNLKDYLPYKLR